MSKSCGCGRITEINFPHRWTRGQTLTPLELQVAIAYEGAPPQAGRTPTSDSLKSVFLATTLQQILGWLRTTGYSLESQLAQLVAP